MTANISENALPLVEALRILLLERKAITQEEICEVLENQGFEITQSKAGRLLRKIGAVKVVNEHGLTVCSLAREPALPSLKTPLHELIVNIEANEVMVVVFTSPGSASMVARALDYNQTSTRILGTIAGDDTIFVAPKSIKEIKQLTAEIYNLLRM